MNNFKNFLNELDMIIQKYKYILKNEDDETDNVLSLFKEDNDTLNLLKIEDDNTDNILSLFKEDDNTLDILKNEDNSLFTNDLDDILSLLKEDEENSLFKNDLDDTLSLLKEDEENSLFKNDLDDTLSLLKEDEDNSSLSLFKGDEENSIVYFFYDPRCPACVKTKPIWDIIVDNISKFFKHNTKLFDLLSIDISDKSNESLYNKFDIKYIPTFIIYDVKNKNIFIKKEGSLNMNDMILHISNFYKFMNKI
jgi:thiol-disulfide isomerase/thioredoxin